MGFFSSRLGGNRSPQRQHDEGRILVLARSALLSGSSSVEPEISWSMAVEVPSHVHEDTQESSQAETEGLEEMELLDRRPSGSTLSNQSSYSSSQTYTVEMSLENGRFQISRGSLRPTPTDGIAQKPLLLVKYMLTHQSLKSNRSLTLAMKVEQILQNMTLENSNLTSSQTEIWIRYALRSLQNANILPRGQKLNINNFIYYVQQKTPDYQKECYTSTSSAPSPLLTPMTMISTSSSFSTSSSNSSSSSSTTSYSSATTASTAPSSMTQLDDEQDEVKFVKEVNYQTHLDENARLKAMFDWAPPPTAIMDTRTGKYSAVVFGNSPPPPGIHSATNGSFWISRPQATAVRVNQRPNPYGGLM